MDWKRIGRIGLTSLEWIGVVVFGLLLVVGVAVGGLLAWVGEEPPALGEAGRTDASTPLLTVVEEYVEPPPAATAEEASSLFAPIHEVLLSPRCMNCHPNGDRPLARVGGAHAMNVSRASADSGLACSTCHADHNSKVPGGPPGAPHWGLPPADTPMVFQGRSVTELCLQLRDLERNGQRSLADLHEHMEKDPLVLWAWEPGGDRKPAPGTHEQFVAAVAAWVEAGGICPGETEPPMLGSEPTAEEVAALAEAGAGENAAAEPAAH